MHFTGKFTRLRLNICAVTGISMICPSSCEFRGGGRLLGGWRSERSEPLVRPGSPRAERAERALCAPRLSARPRNGKVDSPNLPLAETLQIRSRIRGRMGSRPYPDAAARGRRQQLPPGPAARGGRRRAVEAPRAGRAERAERAPCAPRLSASGASGASGASPLCAQALRPPAEW